MRIIIVVKRNTEAQIRVTSLGVKMSLIDNSPADIQKTQAVQMMGYFIQGCIFDIFDCKSNSIGSIPILTLIAHSPESIR